MGGDDERPVIGDTVGRLAFVDLRYLPREVGELGDAEATVPVAELRNGDVVKVLPGGQVPVDGTVLRGASEVDESTIDH